MVKIIRPEERAVQQSANISEAVAGSSAQGPGAVAQAEIAAGRQFQDTNVGQIGRRVRDAVAQANDQVFEETKRAHQNALYSQKFSEGARQFMALKQERESIVTDENGNPTFETLVDDIGNIGSQVINDITAGLNDPVVADKLSNNLLNFISNQQISALNTAKSQQLDFATASLQGGLADLSDLALSDSYDNIATYETQVQELLANAVQSGVIPATDAQAVGDNFSTQTRKGSLENLIVDDLDTSGQLLLRSADELGISESDLTDLRELHGARNEDIQREIEQIQKEEDRHLKEQRADAFNELQLGINTGVVNKADILKQKETLSETQLNALLTVHESRTKDEIVRQDSFSKINDAIESDLSVATVASPSRINDHYKDAVLAPKDDGTPLTLTDRAKIALRYNAPVQEFANEMEYITEFGDAGLAQDLLQAFGEIKSRNSPALNSKFSATAESVLRLAERYAEVGGMPPGQALQDAREKIYKASPEEKAQRRSAFNSEMTVSGKPLYRDNIADTLADRLSSFFTFGDPGEADITPEAAATYKDLVEREFYATGDKAASLDMAAEAMQKNYGMSTLNEVTRFMKFPPELMYNLPSGEIQQLVNTDVAGLLPQGVDPTSVQLVSDQLTRGVYDVRPDGTRKEVIKYGISYTDSNGTRRLLLDDNGLIVRWGL